MEFKDSNKNVTQNKIRTNIYAQLLLINSEDPYEKLINLNRKIETFYS